MYKINLFMQENIAWVALHCAYTLQNYFLQYEYSANPKSVVLYSTSVYA